MITEINIFILLFQKGQIINNICAVMMWHVLILLKININNLSGVCCIQINNFNYFVKNLSFSQKKLFNDLYNITNMADEWYINYSETVDINGEIKSIDCIK